MGDVVRGFLPLLAVSLATCWMLGLPTRHVLPSIALYIGLSALLLAKLPPESAGVPDPGARWLDDVAVGASHGDWSPQNLSVVQGGVAAWDWERFAEDRPLGFDAAHLVLMQQLGRTPSGGNLLRLAREELGPWQPSLDDARLDELARLVLLDLLARYVGDGLARSGGPGRDVVARIRAATAARDTTDPRRTR